MYLKSIELNGFKSFANKTVLTFPHGITGVVGPNGSGKSNIADAVRWVLGEQSAKQLRGAKMEDVIFSGTENRKALGLAYVAITFDNHDHSIAIDYDEVKVSRRVYRSGESEYRLNGSLCRRRDIVELFYDTGIGKEGYSIIGQGQVEKILSGKIEDSRELFDEAAGIAKYKKNRQVAEKSLEQERANLARVTDILTELENQVGPLYEQSKKAKDYLKLRDRQKELDVHLFLYDTEKDQKEQKKEQERLRIVQGDLEETRERSSQIEQKANALTLKSKANEKVLEDEENRLLSLQKDRDQIAQKVTAMDNEIASNTTLIAHYQQMKQEGQEETQSKGKDLEDQEDKAASLESQLEDLKAVEKIKAVEYEKTAKKVYELQSKVQDSQSHLMKLMNSQSDTREQLSRSLALEDQLKIRHAEYNSRILSLSSEKNEIAAQKEELIRRKALIEKQVEEAGKSLAAARQREAETDEKIRLLTKESQEYAREAMKGQSRYDTLLGLVERYDGYNQAIRRVMEQKKYHKEIIGVVADILTMDQRYETAIEIALGGSLQNIVTEDDRIAREMIGFLKKNHYGRATFLPLLNIRPRNNGFNPRLLQEEGVIGPASSLVQVEDRFRELAEYLLGRTLVVENVDYGLALSKKNHYSLRIVTLDGELLNPGGSITGGAYRHKGNLLGRRRELEEWKDKLETARNQEQKARKELEEARDSQNASREEAESQEKVYRNLSIELHDLENQLPTIEKREMDNDGRTKKLQKDFENLKAQIAEIQTEKQGLLEKKQDTSEHHEKSQGKIDELKKELEESEQLLADQEEQKKDGELSILSLSQQVTFARQNQERLQGEIAEKQEQIKSYQRKADQLNKQNEELSVQKAEAEKTKSKKVQIIDNCEKKIQEFRRRGREFSEEQSKIFKEQRDCNDRLLTLEKEESSLSHQLEKISDRLDQVTQYMWENYELTYHSAQDLRQYKLEDLDIKDLRRQKTEIAKHIKALGNVNLAAIEEYQEVGKRYEFTKSQYDDVKEAEQKLVLLIEELNQEMRHKFRENFETIRESFHVVFQDLFEGGNADLEIIDPDDVLESGVRITAQPPGKKLQNILLLSGGERALTAIALLFAIQNLKPSPFCLLDEIEAALDDANIVRFSKYLKKLSEDTQFIVITHRRGTMMAADVLYGITMQEKGISTLISVDLIEDAME